MTCWPQGKEESPIRNRASLAPQFTRKVHTPQQSVSDTFLMPWLQLVGSRAGRWDPTRHSRLPQNCGPNAHAEALCCDLDCGQLPPSRRPRWERSRESGSLPPAGLWGSSPHTQDSLQQELRVHQSCTLTHWGSVDHSRSRCFISKQERKSYHFFIQNFSQIYRIIAFICLFIF